MTAQTTLQQRAPGDRRQRLTDRRAVAGVQPLEDDKRPSPQLYVVQVDPSRVTDVDDITLGERD